MKTWRNKYSKSSVNVNKIEEETPHKLRSAITEVLSDEQSTGAPPKFKNEQVATIIALSCEQPAKFGLPFSHWTPELLQIEAIRRNIVESTSIRQIGCFLKRK